MPDFYALSPAQQARQLEVLARRALADWGIGDDARISLIKHRENAVFSVSCDRGRYAMRVHRADYHSDSELAAELTWIEALAGAGVRTPQVQPLPDGRPFAEVAVPEIPEARQVDLLEWFVGEPIATIESGFDTSIDIAATFGAIGRLMARIHNHSEGWDLPQDFCRHAWDEEGLLGEAPFWGRFWDCVLLNSEQRQRLLAVRERARHDLARFGRSARNFGLIHADLLPENILHAGDQLCIIDFDDAGFGWHLFDAATTLFFLQGEDYYADARAALVEGYRTERPLSEDDLEWLDFFLLMRGLTYLGWVHTRPETETAQAMGPLLVEMVDGMAAAYLEEAL